MTNHHIGPRAAVTLLAPLLAGALTLTAVTAPTYADSAENSGSYDDDTYIVKLADAPVAAYEGGLPRLKRTAPTAGKRLDADSATVEKYVAHLDDRRERVLDAVPGIETLHDYSYTFNGFAAELTGRQAAKLSATPGVVSVTRNTVAQLTDTGPDHGPGADVFGRAGADGGTETYIRVVADGRAEDEDKDEDEARFPAPEAQQAPSPLKDERPAGPPPSGARGTARETPTGPAAADAPHAPSSKTPGTTRSARFPDTPVSSASPVRRASGRRPAAPSTPEKASSSGSWTPGSTRRTRCSPRCRSRARTPRPSRRSGTATASPATTPRTR